MSNENNDDIKIYDPETKTWRDNSGHTYIENKFDERKPVWIDITGSRWEASHSGILHYIEWNDINLPPAILEPLQLVIIAKLHHCAVGYITKARNTLETMATLIVWSNHRDFGDVSMAEISKIWAGLHPSYRTYFRQFYYRLAVRNLGNASQEIALELKSWKARDDIHRLRDVLNWDEEKGALTSVEEDELRKTLKTPLPNESDKQHAVRIYAWLMLETFKRAYQILRIKNDGIRKITSSNGQEEWFVMVPPVKRQTGAPDRWWKISKSLAQEIERYSNRPQIKELQQHFKRLLVWDVRCLKKHGIIAVADANSALYAFMSKSKAISPRTGKPLHITPLRIRHTCGTRLAYMGVARDIIQQLFEHDSPESAQAYIDAVNSELLPAIERAGWLNGNIFFELNKHYFQGHLSTELDTTQQVMVPEFTSSPLIVGACKRDILKDGACKKHPFLSCYTDCHCFQAWANPEPHIKALTYFEKEVERYDAAEGRQERQYRAAGPAVACYKKAVHAVREILAMIGGEYNVTC